MTRVTFIALLALASVACSKEPPAQPAPSSSDVDAAPQSRAAPPSRVEPSTCNAKIEATNALVAAGGACTSDGDCECFNGGVSPKYGCGGVTDRSTAKKLAELTRAYAEASCKGGIACAAWQCAPICEDHRCQNGPRRRATP